jgi:hypothetical protein
MPEGLLVIGVQRVTDMAAAKAALHNAENIGQDGLSPALSESGLTVGQSLEDIVHSLAKLVQIAEDFSKVDIPLDHDQIFA